MKVILLEDVNGVGKAGETKEVAEGYGRHFLLPKKMAVLASAQYAAQAEAQLKSRARRQARTESEMTELARQLEGREFVLKARAGEQERLYGSVTNADIAEELSKNGFNVDKKKIVLEEPIHQLGSFEIPVKLLKDIEPRIKVTVARAEAE
ncbi:MAG: 50S ribosomal protein L9 [Chloroflexi bacterium]|nr:50S ribosomal protein L9 [Chloroflexota bacterium]